MPELPEVETIRRGLLRPAVGQRIVATVIREPRLRWPVPADLPNLIQGQHIKSIERRGKYLLFVLENGALLIHLGMSGTLRVLDVETPLAKHDHLDIVLQSGALLRFNDPRRFGSVLWTNNTPISTHPLLVNLGPEPLSDDFNPDYLAKKAHAKKTAIKQLIMNSAVVVGVGNIYANEALYQAGIRPQRAASSLSVIEIQTLTKIIKNVLEAAIKQGGTTLKDFRMADGKPGYFKQSLRVYGRADQPCLHCGHVLLSVRMAQRATVYCGQCQQ